MTESIVVESRFCGVAGMGQGGYLAGLIAGSRTGPYQIDFRNPIPLDVELAVEPTRRGVHATHADKVIVEGKLGEPVSRVPDFVPLGVASEARSAAEANSLEIVSTCFSCGSQPDTLRVHAGPVGDGRFATPYTPPAWVAPEGVVEPSFVWAPLDCAAGWCLSWDPPRPRAVTGMLTLEVLADIEPHRDHVIVADSDGPWHTRTRRAWSALYTSDGELVARSESLWVALRQPVS
ncbi:MAG: hypothetical protein ACFCVC_14390 [Acidimicrobiia bacterium]